MIIHSIVPDDLIYEGIESLKAPEELTHQGHLMQVEHLTNGRARIIRLLSCDLAPYLDPAFAPGQIITIQSE